MDFNSFSKSKYTMRSVECVKYVVRKPIYDYMHILHTIELHSFW